MPQIASAKKDLRTNARKRVINDRWRKKLRESLHTLQSAITTKDKKTAQAEFLKTQSVLDRAARHKIIHPNKAARKKARLHKAIHKL
jgi:small subunit ribosomal protein S20